MDNKWHKRFVELAEHVASWSKEEVKVGAVLVDSKRRVKGIGYNGAPEGYDDSKVTPQNSDYVVVHAEVNALLNSSGSNLTMFVTRAPCLSCAGSIASGGIVTKLVCPKPVTTGRWGESSTLAVARLLERGVEVEFL